KPCPLPMPVLELEAALERRRMVREYIFKYLEIGIDYGAWKGPTNPNASKEAQKQWVLRKPGAQKLAEAFDLRTRNHVTYREVCAARVLIESECDVLNGAGEILATRTGICSTDEPRFDYLRKDTETANYPPVVHNVQAMAAKRAFVEALEAALGLGGLFAEEDDTPARQTVEKAPRADQVEAARKALDDKPDTCRDCTGPLTAGQRDYSLKHYGAPLCPAHQRHSTAAAAS
ncbi:MAG: hypothetical protein JWN15_821, partial [Firmicutes bacterium]|nr:hypothetical protein [Bacillota bacterium]